MFCKIYVSLIEITWVLCFFLAVLFPEYGCFFFFFFSCVVCLSFRSLNSHITVTLSGIHEISTVSYKLEEIVKEERHKRNHTLRWKMNSFQWLLMPKYLVPNWLLCIFFDQERPLLWRDMSLGSLKRNMNVSISPTCLQFDGLFYWLCCLDILFSTVFNLPLL